MKPSNPPALPREGSPIFSTQAAGFLFRKASLIILAGILLVAAWGDQAALILLLAILLCAAALSALSSWLSLQAIDCRRLILEPRLFPGETTTVLLQVFNRKPLPLPWLQAGDAVPFVLLKDEPALPADRPGYGLVSRFASLRWYAKASWKIRLTAHKRGYYLLGPLEIISGDIFGFYTRRAVFPRTDPLLVYPRIFPVEQLGIPSLHPLGDSRTRQRIFQDPSRAAGVRDYQPQDSLKSIHWKASARRQRLQVKIFEPATTLKVGLFLAVDSFPPEAQGAEAGFELAVSAAASIACRLIDRGGSAGLFVNGRQADSGRAVSLAPGGSGEQLILILEALAKATRAPTAPFTDFLQEERKVLPLGTTLVFLLARTTPSLLWSLRDLRTSGHKLLVLLAGEEAAWPEATIPCHLLHPPADPGDRP